jgi:hypothetical protein
VGNVFLGEEFECLQELNLDSNLLVEVSGEKSTHPEDIVILGHLGAVSQ